MRRGGSLERYVFRLVGGARERSQKWNSRNSVPPVLLVGFVTAVPLPVGLLPFAILCLWCADRRFNVSRPSDREYRDIGFLAKKGVAMIRPPVSAAQTCVPFPYGAGQQDQILKVRPFRQDLLAATERRDLLFCAARPGVRFHAEAAATYRFRPVPSWERVQSAGAAILRMDGRTRRGSINSWDFGNMRPG